MVSGLLLVGSLAVSAWCFWHPANPADRSTRVKACILAAWTVGPPIYFLFEYWRWGPRANVSPDWEEFKYSQELAAKIWVALVSVLAILYFGKDILDQAGKAAGVQ